VTDTLTLEREERERSKWKQEYKGQLHHSVTFISCN
jgi:hypothetical protein